MGPFAITLSSTTRRLRAGKYYSVIWLNSLCLLHFFKMPDCYRCGKAGHMVRSCPDTEKACYQCSKTGHLSRDCPTPKDGPKDGPTCYSCGKTGHLSRNCSNDGGSSNRSCYKCGEPGHISRDCTSSGNGQVSGKCYK